MKYSKILLIAIITLSTFSIANAQGYKIGDPVADFSLKNVDGTMTSLKSFPDAKGIIVIFTCNHCPYAKLYEDRIIKLHQKYASMGYPVIAINPNDPIKEPEDSYENMVKRAKAKQYPFPYVFDSTQKVARTFGASRTPHVFLLQRVKDNYKVAYIGAIDDNPQSENSVEVRYVENAIGSLSNNQTVALTSTKAIGCTIKWKE